jgi:outer membrane protein assembly factor BamB
MRLIVPVSLAALVATASLSAQGWPQWRGPARDATVAATDAPSAWPAAFARAWRVDVGEGYASPVVGAGIVFVHTRKDPQEVVTAVDARTGAV